MKLHQSITSYSDWRYRLCTHSALLFYSDPMTYPAPKIIGLCGPKGVGKSTYAKSFEGAANLSFATPIKEMLKVILPHPAWLEKKEEPIPGFPDGITIRHMLQQLGTSFGRETVYTNIWVDIAMRKALITWVSV